MAQNQTSQATQLSAPMSQEELKRELLKIAKEYGYSQQMIRDILIEPELIKDIVMAYRKGRKTTGGWVRMAMMAY